MKYYLLPFFLLPLLFTSCEGDVRFTADQPAGIVALKEVPAALVGDFADNSDTLYIRSGSITLVRPSRISIPISDTAKVGMYKSKSGKYVFHAGADRYVERETKDSLIIVTRNAQIYKLGKDTILKSFDGAYWLSMRDITKKDEWKLMHITLHKGKLAIAVASLPKDEKKRMQERMDVKKSTVDSLGTFSCVTPFHISSDQTYYIISPTSDELKNLDRRGLFRPVATFIKVK